MRLCRNNEGEHFFGAPLVGALFYFGGIYEGNVLGAEKKSGALSAEA